MFKALVFDFNGIFVQPIEQRILAEVCKATGFGRWLALSNYFFLLPDLQQGRLSPREFWKRVFPQLTEQEYIEMVELEYEKPFARNEDAYSLAQQLSGRMQVHVLSNSNFLQGKAYRKQKLYRHFTGLFLSHETGAMKPFPSAFRHFLAQTGLKAGECVFVDDSAVNVFAARAMGFRSIMYKGNRQLVAELNRIGIV
ncbi:MAG: HAD-IA family hydrolase [Candidatus Diapherotrites archaeon]|uniref:HAD-IA family hydrolase n=1 Tax=Candidatus Iainarchaeum sp. TaxID=3101447 RepID=A0A8T3YI22_9ARCH|nr:HAD-IA family hydrolase [Candidatus Diapherotrites archaeon]